MTARAYAAYLAETANVYHTAATLLRAGLRYLAAGDRAGALRHLELAESPVAFGGAMLAYAGSGSLRQSLLNR